MAGRRRPNVECDLGVPLLLPRLEVLEGRESPDQLLAEGAEVISPRLGGRDYQDVIRGVQEELVACEDARQPTLPYPSVRHDQQSAWTVLEVLGNVILDRRGVWEVQVFPGKVDQVPEVTQWMLWGFRCHRRGDSGRGCGWEYPRRRHSQSRCL